MDSSDVKVANGVGSNGRLLMARPGHGSKGRTIQLLTNHLRVALPHTLMENACLYHYDVALFYAYTHPGGTPVERATDAYKGVERRVMDRVFEIYHTELFKAKNYAYDGDKSLFTVCALESNNLEEYEVILEDISSSKVGVNTSPEGSESDKKRMKRLSRSKTFKVKIRYAAKIPIQAIADGLHGQESSYFQGPLRALDIILRQHAARQGCLLVKQSFLHVDPRNFMDLNGGVQGCRGFHSSFRATQDGLSLNVDVTTTLTVRPGPVLDFLLRNQNVSDPNMIDWTKAKRMLKNLRIKVNNIEYKITGLSDLPCRSQKFLLRQGRNDHGEVQSVEITVLEYFEIRKQINLPDSADMPCIDVGKPKSPCYFPMELCNLVSLQRYTEALTNLQRAALVSQSRQRPQERRTALTDLLRNNAYENEPMLRSSGITIDSQLAPIQGRILQAPKISVGNDEQFFPQDGRWNFNDKKLADPVKIERWAVVIFSKPCDIQGLWNDLMKCAKMKGIFLNPPFQIFEENPQFKREPASVRVERMYSEIKSKLPWKPQLLLCILPERKNSDIYGPWKRRNLCDEGVFTQCIAPTRVNDQYLTNVLLKINAKLGGMNFFLSLEGSHSIPLVSQEPTLILGMDVSHGSPGRSDAPSIAAVVSSRCWPEISRYRAAVRTQSPKVEMIANLFKPVDTEDHGIIRELLVDFRASSGDRKPKHIIIFRVGVSESQFNQVLNIELDQIIQACKHLDESWDPKFTLIVAQKNHHTKFFQANSPHNVPPGTVVDKSICHPKNNDFYMCAHAAKIGTTLPTHYHVLYDDIGFSADALQELVHSLSYVYQRSTTAISVVAPICYAHLAASQMGQFMKFDEFSESSSSHGGVTSAGASQVPELPRLHENVTSSMFFC